MRYPEYDDVAADEVVRPFILTAGRTRPVHQRLALETLVSAPPATLSAPLDFERRRIAELCQQPLSVAEIAALLPAPLGVARVLVADLEAAGFVVVHHPARGGADEGPSVALLERIRDRLLAL